MTLCVSSQVSQTVLQQYEQVAMSIVSHLLPGPKPAIKSDGHAHACWVVSS